MDASSLGTAKQVFPLRFFSQLTLVGHVAAHGADRRGTVRQVTTVQPKSFPVRRLRTEKPRRVIGAGSSEAQPEMALLPNALLSTSKVASSSGAVAAAIAAWPDCWGCSYR